MKVNITAYIGLNYYGVNEWTPKEAQKVILIAMKAHGIKAATFTEAVGFWEEIAETSVRVEWLDVNEENARKCLTDVCHALAQYEVCYTVNGAGLYTIENSNASNERALLKKQA